MAWLPPSPPPRPWIWEKPVAWGVMLRVALAAVVWAIPLYLGDTPLAKSAHGASTRPWMGHSQRHDNPTVTPKGDRDSIVSVWAGGAYIYFMSTSSASVPPGELYIWLNIGDMSAWRMDWRISMTVAKWTSCGVVRHKSAQCPLLCACARAGALRPGFWEPGSQCNGGMATVAADQGETWTAAFCVTAWRVRCVSLGGRGSSLR
jgi:hypothetical protein